MKTRDLCFLKAIAFLTENNLLSIHAIKNDEIDQKYMAYKAWCIDRNTYPFDNEDFMETLNSIGVIQDADSEKADIEDCIGTEFSGELIQHSVLAFLASEGFLVSKAINAAEALVLVNGSSDDSPPPSLQRASLMIYMYKFGIINVKILLDFYDSRDWKN